MAELPSSRPQLFPHSSPQAGGRTTQWGGDSCSGTLHTWPGNLLWEHKSIFHWVLMISGAGHQTQLEHSGRLRVQSLTEDRHALQVPLTPKTEVAVWKICQQCEGCQRGKDWTELYLTLTIIYWKGQVEDTSPVLPWPNRSDTLMSPRYYIPLAGGSAPRCFPVNHRSVRLYCLLGRRRLSHLSWPSLGPILERRLQEPAPGAPSSQRAA